MADAKDPEEFGIATQPELSTPSGAELRPKFVPVSPEANFLKRWLYWLIFPNHRDARKKKRESLSWLVAYFFTGGTPVPYFVRDVNSKGIYLYTEERWSVGTILRLTLADTRQPSPMHSLTINATVMRFGKDGMGLKFVLYNPKERQPDWSIGYESVDVSESQVREFLDLIRAGSA